MAQYSWNAEDYREHSTAQQKWARELIDKLRLAGDEHLLDIGCGDGKISAELAKALPRGQVVGIDKSADMIHLAQQEFPPQKYSNLQFLQMEATAIDLKQSFDLVFSNAVLHWVMDHRAVLTGIRRVLKPAGKILLQMGGKGNAAGLLRILDVMLGEERWQNYFHDFSFPYFFPAPDFYRSLLEETGFRSLRTELLPREMSYPDRAGLEGWIRTTWLPYTQRVPEKLRPMFIAELIDRYLTVNQQGSSKQVTVAMIRLEVEAVKV